MLNQASCECTGLSVSLFYSVIFFLQVWINNARVRIAQLAGAMRDLAQHGPMKPAAEQGIDEVRCAVHTDPKYHHHILKYHDHIDGTLRCH